MRNRKGTREKIARIAWEIIGWYNCCNTVALYVQRSSRSNLVKCHCTDCPSSLSPAGILNTRGQVFRSAVLMTHLFASCLLRVSPRRVFPWHDTLDCFFERFAYSGSCERLSPVGGTVIEQACNRRRHQQDALSVQKLCLHTYKQWSGTLAPCKLQTQCLGLMVELG